MTIGWSNAAQHKAFCTLIAQRMAEGYRYTSTSPARGKRVIANNATKIIGAAYQRALTVVPGEIRRFVESGDVSIVICGTGRRLRQATSPQEVIENDTIEESTKYDDAKTVDRSDRK